MMAWRRRWFIAVPFALCVYGTLVVSSLLPNMYESETLILIVPQQIPDTFVRSTVTMRTEDRLSALSQQVLSRTALERLIAKFDLYQAERAKRPMQEVVEKLRSQITVEPIRSSSSQGQGHDAFYIRFKYPNAVLSAKVTEQLGSVFIEQNSLDRGSLAENTDEFLRTQLAEARTRLEDQERKLEQFREQHAGRLPSQLQFNMQAITNAQLQAQALSEALARDRDRKLMLERLYNDYQTETASVVQSPSAAPSAQVGGGAMVGTGGTTKERLASARSSLATLELTRKPEHPDVIRLKHVIEDLEKQDAAESAQHGGAPSGVASTVSPEQMARMERIRQTKAEMESLDRQIGFKEAEQKRLQDTVAEFQQRIEAVPGTETEWTALTRDYDTQQAAYKDLLTKSEQAKVASNLEQRQIGEQFRVLDPPRLPERPISPNRVQISAAGLALGLLCGIAFAALLELRDTTFRTESDVIQVLDLPVVAVVPSLVSAADLAAQRGRQRFFRGMAGAATIAGAYGFWIMKLWRYVA
jgi:protein tyrosine kinase modulator